jgi:IS605 OrfB family transposase
MTFTCHKAIAVPAAAPVPVTEFIGVDLGIANIATDSDGTTHTGTEVERVRRKHNLQRKRLQRRGTKGAKKELKRIARKESRFRRHQNYCISKTIVEKARGTARGIVLEDLKDIRGRITARGTDARNRLSGWSFGQLYAFLTYSQTCVACGHCSKSNRKSQAVFVYKACCHGAHADVNSALNIMARATRKMTLELDNLRVEPESPRL